MSVINQMLQDLERRHAGPEERRALPDEVRSLPPLRSGVRGRKVAGWTVAIAAAAGVAWVAVGSPQHVFRSLLGEPGIPADTAMHAAPDAPVRQRPSVPPAAVPEAAVQGAASAGPVATPAAEVVVAPAARMSTELTLPARAGVSAADGVDGDTRATSRREERRRDGQARRSSREPDASREGVTAPSANVMAAFGTTIVPGAASPVASSAIASMASAAAGEAAARPAPRTVEGPPARIDRQEREPTARERAETSYRRGVEAMHEGRAQPAEQLLREALTFSPAHEAARQTLLGMLVEQKRNADAEVLLLEGQRQNPSQLGFAMALARLQVERGDVSVALDTLQRSSAAGRERPEFIAFQAGLLARAGRAREAAQQYQAALRLSPQTGVWWMGLAMSLEADKRPAEAAEAFQRARDSNSLNAELNAFVEQRMRGLQGR